ncbi:IGR protein motif-domain-containing protein, partial [Globomyces pollinis-pini]
MSFLNLQYGRLLPKLNNLLPKQFFLNQRFYMNKSYLELDSASKLKFIPPQTETLKEPVDFLKTIGRDCESVADKFQSWDHLFTCTTKELESMGIKPKMRKYILSQRHWFCRGKEPVAIEIPKRRHNYLKLKAAVKLLRLKKLGLA